MSVDIHVILKQDHLATPGEWQQAITAAGFALELDTDFDPEEHLGYLPCRYQDEEAGFEYSFCQLEEGWLDDEVMQSLGDRDSLVTFTTRSDMNGFISSTIASAVLCAITGGLLLDDSSEELFVEADKAIAYGRAAEAAILGESDEPVGPFHEFAAAGLTPALEVSITHEGVNAPIDISYMNSPRYQELRTRQLEIFLSLDDPDAPGAAELAELQAIDRELGRLRDAKGAA